MMLRLVTLSLLCFLLNFSSSQSAITRSLNGSVPQKESPSSPPSVSAETSTINDTLLSLPSLKAHKNENNDVTRAPFATADKASWKPAASVVKAFSAATPVESAPKAGKFESSNLSEAKSSSNDKCSPNPCKHGDCSNVSRNESTMAVFQKKGYRCACHKGFEGFNCERKVGSRISATFISSVTFFSVLAFYVIILLIGFVLKAKKARATKGKYSPSDAEKDDKKITAFVLQPPTFERLI